MAGATPPNDRGRPPSRSPRPDAAPATKWPDCVADGYFDQSGHLLPGYMERGRMEQLARDMAGSRPELTMHQVRRFFQHCRAIEARLRAGSSWAAEQAVFRKLDVAAADAFGKSPPKIPELFHDFIKKNVAAVRTETDFLDGFLPHFEALVGFGTQFIRVSERS
jgi:DUF310 family protein family protein